MTDQSQEEEKENPRTTRVRQIILDCACDLLLNSGAGEVTATRVAQETGVARTTIYRHWPDQASLVMETIDCLVAPHVPTPSSGSLETDLQNTLTGLRGRLVTRNVRPVFAALVDYSSRDKSFVPSQQRFVEGLIQPTTTVLEAAQERGELPARLDCAVAATLLAGPLIHQYLVMHEDIEDQLINQVTTQFISLHATR